MKYRKSENCCILGKSRFSRKKMIKIYRNFSKILVILQICQNVAECLLNVYQSFSGFPQNAAIFTFSIFQCYFAQVKFEFKFQVEFVRSNKFEVQVQPATFFATQHFESYSRPGPRSGAGHALIVSASPALLRRRTDCCAAQLLRGEEGRGCPAPRAGCRSSVVRFPTA